VRLTAVRLTATDSGGYASPVLPGFVCERGG